MKVKICGITNREDAREAIKCGADALGFIFVKSSPRYISTATARRIIDILPPFIVPVGIIANESIVEIKRIVKETDIRCLQFHGTETPEDVASSPVPAYKAFHIDDAFDLALLGKYSCSMYLLDTSANGIDGGSGRVFDWKIAVAAKKFGRIILAGGLTPDNIVNAILTVDPYAVDVNSGVESSPGRKDPSKLRMLFDRLGVKRHENCTATAQRISKGPWNDERI